MDWFSWLSKTRLEPSLVYEYGLMFSNNELEEADIVYFNHEFLQSMGISIAKHRLEILKLVRRSKCCSSSSHPMSRILIAIKRTKRSFSKYLRTWIRCDESSLAIVPAGSYSSSSRHIIKKNKRLMVGSSRQSRAPLLLTNGNSMLFPSSRINSFSSPLALEFPRDDQKLDADCCGVNEVYWPYAVEDIRWDSMFQNLKPT